MTHYRGGNYSHDKISKLSAKLKSGDTLEKANLSQKSPNTVILTGFTGLTFIKCNLINCSVPSGSVIESCNVRQVSRCVHLHPDWGLDAEIENCPHVIDTDTIIIDGVVVDTIYHRKDTIV